MNIHWSFDTARRMLSDTRMDDDKPKLVDYADKLGGLPVLALIPGSGAASAGVKPGDIVIQVNGKNVRNVDDYLEAKALDANIMLVKIRRQGVHMDISIPLTSSDMPAVNMRTLSDAPPS